MGRRRTFTRFTRAIVRWVVLLTPALSGCDCGASHLQSLDAATFDASMPAPDAGPADAPSLDRSAPIMDAGSDAPDTSLADADHTDGGRCPDGLCRFRDGSCVAVMPGKTDCCSCNADGICSICVCASPDTPIATPFGERPIASLLPGELVFSVDRGALRPVPIARVSRTAVGAHGVVRVTLATGAVLEISGGHPTADGRTFADLTARDALDGIPITAVETVPYGFAFTYDILPASDTGTYVAGGALIGSTLGPRPSR